MSFVLAVVSLATFAWLVRTILNNVFATENAFRKLNIAISLNQGPSDASFLLVCHTYLLKSLR